MTTTAKRGDEHVRVTCDDCGKGARLMRPTLTSIPLAARAGWTFGKADRCPGCSRAAATKTPAKAPTRARKR